MGIMLLVFIIVVALVFGLVAVRKLILTRKNKFYMIEAGLIGSNAGKNKDVADSGKGIELN